MYIFSNGSEDKIVPQGRFPSGKRELPHQNMENEVFQLKPQNSQAPPIKTDNLIEVLVNFRME